MERVQCVLLALVLLCVCYSIDGFPDFIENINGLKITRNSNVCRYPKTRIVNVTTPVRHQITRIFMKICYSKVLKMKGFLAFHFRKETYQCLDKIEQKNVTINETRTQTSYGYSFECCLHWKKTRPSDTDCKTPICPNGCRPHGKCIAGDTCKCDIGWQGYTCGQDINECYVQNGGCQQGCSNTLGSYRCGCRKGYKTHPSDPTKCIDINECTSNKSKCFCYGNDQHCTGNIKCLNTIGSFKCKCPKGYRLINPTTCIDVDECLSWNSCQQKCTNQPGSYQCSCFTGLKYVKKTNKCEDINECSNNNGGCQQKCLNVYSSYLCRCNFGYRLARDRKNCIKYNIPGLDD